MGCYRNVSSWLWFLSCVSGIQGNFHLYMFLISWPAFISSILGGKCILNNDTVYRGKVALALPFFWSMRIKLNSSSVKIDEILIFHEHYVGTTQYHY